jgi:hypothetical protein
MQQHDIQGSSAAESSSAGKPSPAADWLHRARVHVIATQDADIRRLQDAIGVTYVHAIDLLNQLAGEGVVSGMNSSGLRRVMKLRAPR